MLNVSMMGRTARLLTLAAALAACASSNGGRPEFAASDPAPLPGPPGAKPLAPPQGEPEDLPGIDTNDLVPRERHAWWRLISQLYAPCADQPVSIAQCVREARACAACAPAARLLAAQVRRGSSPADAQAAYAVRFGPDVKKIDPADSPARGPEGAPVQIVVWSDFQCPACKRAVPMLEQALERHAPHVRLIHKFYPLRAHQHAEGAARAAIAAKDQGRYWQMERLLFENQQALEEADLVRYAERLGLNLDRFRADMTSERATGVIARDKEAADRAGLDGTPYIVINGRVFNMALFSLDADLDPWIRTEVEIAPRPIKAATGSAP